MTKKGKKSLGRRIFRWIFWGLGSLVILVLIVAGIIVNFIFTPSKLTPLVE